MLAGSVNSTLHKATTRQLASKPVNAPADRVFKQTLRKKSHDIYYRNLFSGFAGSALLAIMGGAASVYFGYVILGLILLCFSGVFSATNYWLSNAVPDVKVCPPSPSKKTTCSLDKSPMCQGAAASVLFRGVSYPIDYQAASGAPPIDVQVPDKPTLRVQ